MYKFRFAWLLPIFQLVIAIGLLEDAYHAKVPKGSELYVPTTRLICQGLNAPALLFRLLNPGGWGPDWDGLPRSILGFDTHDLFFLAGVIVVWCVIGRAIDRRRTANRAQQKNLVRALLQHSLLFVPGLILLHAGFQDLRYPRYNNPAHLVGAALTLAWSASLIVVAGAESVRGMRTMFVHTSA